MIDVDADAGRNFEGLDAREAQAALAEELRTDMDGNDADKAPGGFDWTTEELAGHARMAEALLFAAEEPLDEAAIAARLPTGANIPAILSALMEQYRERGVVLSKIAGKWRFTTATDLAHILETERIEPRRLSRAALETLAIIAYHQPCTRADIEDVRGVMVSKGSLDQLLEIGWVRLRGRRRDVPGRPVLYGTAQSFLEHFGLESVSDLPGLSDLKAAGLLEARLPPGFAIPSPGDPAEAEEFEDEDAPEFARDFFESTDGETAER
ncbi:MAG: SMC-Scp complex subunit ScpB [Parvularculaceae bacterium]